MSFQGLRTVCYKVDDIEQAKEWYTKVLGIPPYFDEPFYVGFNVAGYELGLQPKEHDSDVPSSSVVAYWGVEDVQTTYDHLISKGAKPIEKPTNVGGELMVATVMDPWGNAFGIIYNPEFKLP
jgi:lactoylglutathione lyase